jgi:DNA (cytosine-5)-methyltransferase 1
MVSRIQGFDATWSFSGRKTSVYRQIGNAFPPPVAQSVGTSIRRALGAGEAGGKKHLRVVA